MGGKYLFAVGALLAAGAALAFTPTHLVIVDSASLYEKGYPFEEAHVITTLDYWTGVATIIPEPKVETDDVLQRPTFYVRTESGLEGHVYVLDVGAAYLVTAVSAPVYKTNMDQETVITLNQSEIVAALPRSITGPNIIQYLLNIKNETGVEGWVKDTDIERLSVALQKPPNAGTP